ncbi:MAG: hypothetical protein GY815_11355, partial [Gammaproteobacteria bacterium]|nr:hypothetical protein [Gammaproteobacteria bacterium]
MSDVNDNSPVVTTAIINDITEDTAIGINIGTAAATDVDTDTEFSEWDITAGNTGTAFAINSNTGEITVPKALDYETTSSYSLTVQVSDSTLTGTGTITVNVNDVNDPPVANDDEASVAEGDNVVINVRTNDTDVETATSSLTITNLSAATNGTLVNNDDGTVTYTHDGSETTSDS